MKAVCSANLEEQWSIPGVSGVCPSQKRMTHFLVNISQINEKAATTSLTKKGGCHMEEPRLKTIYLHPESKALPETPFRDNPETKYLSPQIVQGVNVPPSADLKRHAIHHLVLRVPRFPMILLKICYDFLLQGWLQGQKTLKFEIWEFFVFFLLLTWVSPRRFRRKNIFASFSLLVGKTNPVSSLLDPAFEGKGTYTYKYHLQNVVWFLPQMLPPSPWGATS